VRDAGAIPEVFMTAFDALHRQMHLARGEVVLIHAVGSGVGTAAAQLARAWGARSIGTSRTQDKLDRAAELGLDHGVLTSDSPSGESWPQRVLDLTEGRGVDVLMDLVGGPYLAGNLRVLALRGRMIVVGTTAGAKAEIDLGALLRRRASITGTVLRTRPAEEKIALARDFTDAVVPLFETGELKPVIDRFYRPEEIREAHRRLGENRTFGKLVIAWD
jgi:NADPH:quinone reductase-like Zn-dependent oxidoreductase